MSNGLEQNCPSLGDDCPLHDEISRLQQQIVELRDQLRVDSLTGLYNHRYLLECLQKEMERTHRSGLSTGVIMIDLDHFKTINDNYGHEVGNKVLKSVASTVKDSIRKLDIACRYGGEEFTVIVPSCELDVCVKIAERIRSEIEHYEIRLDDQHLSVTASLGLACYSIYRNETPQQLLQRADQHLYAAKHAGRNCIKHDALQTPKQIAVSADEKDAIKNLFG